MTSPPTSPSSYSAHHTFDAFPPPVPPLPKEHHHSREFHDVADLEVFHRPSTSSNVEKPLPEINSEESSPTFDDSDDDQSVVLIPPRAARTPSPTATVTHDSTVSGTISQKRNKRRSMSVSDVDLKRVLAASSSTTPLPRSSGSSESNWHSTLSGIITDYNLKGEFLQLDRISTSFDLPDTYKSSRRPGSSGRSKSDNAVSSNNAETSRAGASSSVPVTPSVNIQPESGTEDSPPSSPVKATGHLPRADPLASSPIRVRSGSGSVPQPRVSGLRYGPRSPVNRSAITSMTYIPSSTRESSDRLRVQHRSTASSSEPSLIPARDEGRLCKCCSLSFEPSES